ncbi:MAG: CPBP family intramembrane metalloprotease [Lachnospiraceae bacterium]|nr:CPBP family intramembrane metalloprotease [Lachnospiraceae bacterium]
MFRIGGGSVFLYSGSCQQNARWYRGFFFGKSSKIFPIWVSAVVSSAVFAAGHIATRNIGIVAYDIAGVFIDSLIFSVIYQKSENCVISTFSHILGNAISLVAVFVFFL